GAQLHDRDRAQRSGDYDHDTEARVQLSPDRQIAQGTFHGRPFGAWQANTMDGPPVIVRARRHLRPPAPCSRDSEPSPASWPLTRQDCSRGRASGARVRALNETFRVNWNDAAAADREDG